MWNDNNVYNCSCSMFAFNTTIIESGKWHNKQKISYNHNPQLNSSINKPKLSVTKKSLKKRNKDVEKSRKFDERSKCNSSYSQKTKDCKLSEHISILEKFKKSSNSKKSSIYQSYHKDNSYVNSHGKHDTTLTKISKIDNKINFTNFNPYEVGKKQQKNSQLRCSIQVDQKSNKQNSGKQLNFKDMILMKQPKSLMEMDMRGVDSVSSDKENYVSVLIATKEGLSENSQKSLNNFYRNLKQLTKKQIQSEEDINQ